MRALLLAAALAVAGAAAAQTAGLRLSLCEGLEAATLDLTTVCGITGFVETSELGVFAQVSPRYGPVYENWEVYAYQPRTLAQLGPAAQVQWWPGIATGFEQGAWFVRVNADILLTINLAPP